MTDTQLYWAFYAFFLVVRIPANVKRCRLPLMRGPGYFYNTRVPLDFFQGPGREILRTYRLWIFAPFLFDAAALALIYRYNRLGWLVLLAIVDAALALTNHIAALKRALRAVKPFAIEEVSQASTVAFSLTTRRLRDYTSLPLEFVMASFNIGALQSLYGQPWSEWETPALLLYFQAGLLLLKRALIAGRTALPQEDAERYLAWREAYRRMMTGSCDAVRFMISATLLLASLRLDLTLLALLAGIALVAWVVWYWIQVRRFMALYTSTRPVKLPRALEPEPSVPPMVCYRPQSPLSFVKGARGWALNLADRRSQIGLAYFIGLVAVGVLLR